MEKKFAVCRVAVAQLRAEPGNEAEIVSQLLFGDHAEIIGAEGQWRMIENAYDNYQGWMDFRQLTAITEDQFNNFGDTFLAPFKFDNTLTAEDGSTYHISAGSTLPFYENGYCYAGAEKFKVNFEPHIAAGIDFKANIVNAAKFFLNTPYLWGKNILGIDCSGFVQIVFKYFGIKMKRDARQQAGYGQLVGFLSECQPGDVAFFDNEAGNITHVGIMIDNQTIIHSSAKVKIDPIDNQGIFNTESGRYTHKLRIIKRFME